MVGKERLCMRRKKDEEKSAVEDQVMYIDE